MSKATMAAVLFLGISASAYAQSDTYGGTYLCMQEFGGGIAYDASSKKWDGTRFNADRKFILRLTDGKTQIIKDYKGEDVQVTSYSVSITAMGDSYKSECSPERSEYYNSPVTVHSSGWVNCSASLMKYSFNLSRLRFLEAYMIGFTDGNENEDNTPSMIGGTCAKIE